MLTPQTVIKKRVYSTPAIEKILIDNEISLVLASDPPIGPGEEGNNYLKPEYFNNDPYRMA